MNTFIIDADPRLCHTQMIFSDVFECLATNPSESQCKHSKVVGEHLFCQHSDRLEFSTLKMPKSIGPTEILVKYINGSFGVVKTKELDELIASEKILAFKRIDEWVYIRIGRLRGKRATSFYSGPERRVLSA
jgi:hypothetical protein